MIFSRTIDQVLAGRKTQTCRLCRAGDELGKTESTGETAVLGQTWTWLYRRSRWIVGHTYAVQRERCHVAEGRIRITGIERIEDLTAPGVVTDAFARAEGFDSAEAFLASWRDLHRSKPDQPVWVLRFELVREKRNHDRD